MIEDNWTAWLRRKLALERWKRQTLRHWTNEAADCREWIAYYEEEIAAHLARKAADPSNVIVLDYYRRPVEEWRDGA